MTGLRAATLGLALALAGPAAAAPLDLPFAAQLQLREERPGLAHALPAGVWTEAGLPVIEAEGRLVRAAYRMAGALTVEQVMAPLRAQLVAAGYEVRLACRAAVCGGFDFRFALDVLPPPEMQVSLDSYAYLAAQHPSDGHVTLLASRAGAAVYLQVSEVRPEAAEGPGALPDAAVPVPAAPQASQPVAASLPEDVAGFGARLEAEGHLALEDLDFASGSARLAEEGAPSLGLLAQWLGAEAGRRVALVGHTDATGAAEANVALSRARAEAVRRALIDRHGAEAARIEAHGLGALAPRASNVSEEGRRANRRVEVVLLLSD